MGIMKDHIKIKNKDLSIFFNRLASKRHENVEMMIVDIFFKGLGIEVHRKVSDDKIDNGEYILIDGYGYLSEDVKEAIKCFE